MIEKIKEEAKKLLESKEVEIVLGCQRSSDGIHAAPLFIEDSADVERLIYDEYCTYNLSVYLPELRGKKVAILASEACSRSINCLIQEDQIDGKDVVFIDVGELPGPEDIGNEIREIEEMPLEERWEYWRKYFSRCLKCYTCRQICPLCYCPTCVADQTMPIWFSAAISLEGNFAWNVIRAFHLAGRCIDCGECERACPVAIPLRKLNNKIAQDIRELFGYEAGKDVEAKPFLASFDTSDPEEFII